MHFLIKYLTRCDERTSNALFVFSVAYWTARAVRHLFEPQNVFASVRDGRTRGRWASTLPWTLVRITLHIPDQHVFFDAEEALLTPFVLRVAESWTTLAVRIFCVLRCVRAAWGRSRTRGTKTCPVARSDIRIAYFEYVASFAHDGFGVAHLTT